MTTVVRNWANMRHVVPISEMKGESVQETRELERMARKAEQFLRSHRWCGRVLERYFGFGIGRVVAIFLFRAKATEPEIDEWLWTIIGDLPPAYLVTEGNPTPADALDAYLEEMQRWVNAVQSGLPVSNIIPVNAKTTRESASALQRRLDFIRTKIAPSTRDARKRGRT